MRSLLLLVALGLCTPALADNKDVAREAFRDGTRYYDLAEFGKALEAFKKAYFNYEEPSFLFNIAQCYRQLNEKAEAVRFYKTYLRKLPGAPNRDEVQRTIATLESMLEKEKAARTEPPTGTLPPAGETRPPPSEPKPSEARPSEPRPSEPPPEARPVEPAPSAVAADQRLGSVAVEKPKPVYKKWWLWTIVGVVVAGAVVGGTLGAMYAGGSSTPTFPSVHVP